MVVSVAGAPKDQDDDREGDQRKAAYPVSAAPVPRMEKDLLRFLMCGSVDDGKSTLIGRLLYDAALLPEDQLAALKANGHRHGVIDADIDFASLVDGLEAEREQGITIDVAYRFFSTSWRKFIVADTPGHEQYTRNMATGASNSDLAVMLIDARKGILPQTRRHSIILSLLGVRHVVLAVNKIDLLEYSQEKFQEIVADYNGFTSSLGFDVVQTIPISARLGDNVTTRSAATPWYTGPSLLDYLDHVDVMPASGERAFRFPVQLVVRPDQDFRGLAGTVVSGCVRVGDELIVARSGLVARVRDIVVMNETPREAEAGAAVTLVLDDELDIGRGDMLTHSTARPSVSDRISARLIWMDEQALTPGCVYLLQCTTAMTRARVTEIAYRIDIDTLRECPVDRLELNEVGLCHLTLSDPLAFDPYDENRDTGGFILIDQMSHVTVAAGMIVSGLGGSDNVYMQAVDLDKRSRAAAKGQKPCILWFTGLSGAGKSTIANLVEKKLHARGRHTYLLDGDNLRHGLNRDLGFTEAARRENVRRVAEIAKLFVDAGLIVIVSLISPFRRERRMARDLVEDGEFIEIFVDAPLDLCAVRDPKGLYRRAYDGEIADFTGVSSPYEVPEKAELILDTQLHTAAELSDAVVDHLKRCL